MNNEAVGRKRGLGQMMRSVYSAPTLALLLLLAGCATPSDPNQGGFIGGVNGLLSGGYERRVASQQQELDAMRAQQIAAQNSAGQYRTALQERQQVLVAMRANVARLNRSVRDMQAKVARQRMQNGAASEKDRQLAQDLENANVRLTKLQGQLQSDTPADDYEATRREYASLQTTIAALSEQLKEGQQ